MATTLKYPKWMYRKDPSDGAFQSTLVATEKVAAELAADGWNDDPQSHGMKVVPYPAELTPAGTLMHHPTRPDANGNHAYGPAPTAPGIGGVVMGGPK
jgi:hypothetical protein